MALTTVTEYVNSLSHEERHAIVASCEKFWTEGAIADEAIRVHTRAWLKLNGRDDVYIVLWMDKMATECFRYYYYTMFPAGAVAPE